MFSRLTRSGRRAAASYRYTGTRSLLQISPATRSARRTHSSRVTPSMGMKGTTSAAPMRGCAPWCAVRSISSTAFATPTQRGIGHRGGRPYEGEDRAIVVGVRFAVQQDHFGNAPGSPVRWHPSWRQSRPSEKLGTHSTSCRGMNSYSSVFAMGGVSGGSPRVPRGKWGGWARFHQSCHRWFLSRNSDSRGTDRSLTVAAR